MRAKCFHAIVKCGSVDEALADGSSITHLCSWSCSRAEESQVLSLLSHEAVASVEHCCNASTSLSSPGAEEKSDSALWSNLQLYLLPSTAGLDCTFPLGELRLERYTKWWGEQCATLHLVGVVISPSAFLWDLNVPTVTRSLSIFR